MSTELASGQALGYDRRMYPVLLELGPFTIYSYGVMMALGFVAAAWLGGCSVPGCSSFWLIGPHFWRIRGLCF